MYFWQNSGCLFPNRKVGEKYEVTFHEAQSEGWFTSRGLHWALHKKQPSISSIKHAVCWIMNIDTQLLYT